ncbi:tumor necrosis factor receptor superfamily member 11A [Paramormyrops kingsleyae]|uniref:Tumor necrosis factor receptor superfamily, member 11a, NFKB activator n=1 Tax=Paramormyrops kingsleyae TaxID=1676925 RepID=A0A3B3RWE1_9TELE|nr:tumor necrosis factor receptor superfamily member 11A-like [Paramormyrops kingsleyae]
MRVDFTTVWIFRGWIPHLVIILYAQAALSRPPCTQFQYLKDKRCCDKCKPGTYAFAPCTSTEKTICRPCGSKEYQPDWNNETKCHPQKFCDKEKGFIPDPAENHTAAVPCQCKPGSHCAIVNCEYCEKINNCTAGYGLTMGKQTGRGLCVPCQHGFFSSGASTEPCKPWTNCKVLGKTEKQAGSDKTDSVCGHVISGISPLWVIVAVLLSLVLICLVILSMFCYKEKLKPLSENLRTCVQTMKSTRIQQEAHYMRSHGPQNHVLLYEEESHGPPNACPSVRLTCEELPASTDHQGAPVGAHSELSEGEPLSSGSCSCMLSARGPLEVGENEDCSQAVAPGVCSCGADPTQEPPSYQDFCPGQLGHSASCDLSLDCGSQTTRHAQTVCEGALSSGPPGDESDRLNEPCCCSIDSTVAPLQSVDQNTDQALSLHDGNKENVPAVKTSLELGLEVSGLSSDTPTTSGQVSGNNNTTFISNGQVMNFSGDVIVVYVNQGSQAEENTREEACGSPVQEESTEEISPVIDKARGREAPRGEASRTSREPAGRRTGGTPGNLPVQEERNEWSQQKML